MGIDAMRVKIHARTHELQQEIVRRTKMEKAFRESEERLDMALSAANEGIWDWHLDSHRVVFDDRYYTMAGYAPQAFPGAVKEWEKRVHPDDIERVKQAIERYLAQGRKTFDTEFRFRRKNGEYMWIKGQGRIVAWDEAGNPTRFIGTHSDITARKQAEDELVRVKNHITNIINSMPSALIEVDGDGRVSLWNQTVAECTGITADVAKGKNLYELLPWMAAEKKNISKSIQDRQVIQDAKRPRKVDGQTRYENITIYPLIEKGVTGTVIRIDDVTEKARLEEMMMQSEKMLTVGGLAAGMAHEINNPLAGMLQNAAVVANRLCANSQIPANQNAAQAAGTTMDAIQRFMVARGIPSMIATIRSSGMRVANIVTNMLSFARKPDSSVSYCQLEDLLEKTLELAAVDYNLKKKYDFKTIEIIKAYAPNMPAVPCHATQIQQVLLNILGNGAQAMQTVAERLSRFVIRTHFEEDRAMAGIEIEDNGPGMDESTRSRVFEPFFTTKPVGVGTGLGLSVSYFIIIDNHKGEITVESQLGVGSTFMIRLPVDG